MKTHIWILSYLLVSPFLLSAQNFTELIPSPFFQLEDARASITDVNGDGAFDLLILGHYGSTSNRGRRACLYLNDGSGQFTEKDLTPFKNKAGGKAIFF